MKKVLFWTLFLVSIAFLDALRDVGRGQFSYWTWHAIKWASFYPPLAWIFWRNIARHVAWWFSLGVVILSWLAWSIAATIWRPEHWGAGGLLNSQWIRWLF